MQIVIPVLLILGQHLASLKWWLLLVHSPPPGESPGDRSADRTVGDESANMEVAPVEPCSLWNCNSFISN